MYREIYKEFASANTIGVRLQHNGFKGGDAGHGGFVRITIKDIASTVMFVNGQESNEFQLEFCGDAERETLLSALKMIVKELEDNKG